MNKSVGNFLFQASQFFATNPRETAYKDIFPKDHMLSLFFKRQEFRKKILEKDEDAEKRKDEQMQRIKQTLQTISQAPQEIPSVSPEAESIVSEYATLVQAKDLGGIDQEQINARKGQIDQKFNGFIDKNPAPLSGLTNLALQKAGRKAGEVVVKKVAGTALGKAIGATLAAVGSVVPVVGTAVGYIIGQLGGWAISKALIGIRKNSGKLLAGAGVIGGFLLGGPIGAIIGGALGAFAAGVDWKKIGKWTAATIGAILAFYVGIVIVPFIIVFIAVPIIVVLILFIINSGAYVVPPAPSISGLGTSSSTNLGLTITSPYIDVQKAASPAGPFENKDLGGGLEVKYTVTVRAKKGSLSNIHFENTCQQAKKGGTLSGSDTVNGKTFLKPCDAQLPKKEDVPAVIDPGTPYTFTYSEKYTSPDFEDSFVVDTFKVTADAVPEKTGAVAAASAVLKIGNPPEDCPSGWPIDGNVTIVQGPNGTYSHYGYQAIDISATAGTPVHATHAGTVVTFNWDNSYGHNIRVISSCNGKAFETVYGHLLTIGVKNGDFVAPGEVIGTVDNTGHSDGNHLHYEFRPVAGGTNDWPIFPQSNEPIIMNPPYIPKTVQ